MRLTVCFLIKKSFTLSPPSWSLSSPARWLQFHQLLPSLSNLVTYIHETACGPEDASCRARATSILSATSVDIDYDNHSSSLTITGYWPESPSNDGWTETIRKGGNEKMEVGILAQQPAMKSEDVKVGGFLANIGEDTMMSAFPPLHLHRNVNRLSFLELTHHSHRTSSFRLPVTPSPTARIIHISSPLPTSNRPPPKPTHLNATFRPRHPSLPIRHDMRIIHIPHPPIHIICRQIPTLHHRPSLPKISQPPLPEEYIRRNRPRSTRLGHRALGLKPPLKTSHATGLGLIVRGFKLGVESRTRTMGGKNPSSSPIPPSRSIRASQYVCPLACGLLGMHVTIR